MASKKWALSLCSGPLCWVPELTVPVDRVQDNGFLGQGLQGPQPAIPWCSQPCCLESPLKKKWMPCEWAAPTSLTEQESSFLSLLTPCFSLSP